MSTGKAERTYYEVLGVRREDSTKVIQQAWKRLLREYHPDRNPALNDHAATLNSAWEVLKDKDKRRKYDESLLARQSAQVVTTPSDSSSSPSDPSPEHLKDEIGKMKASLNRAKDEEAKRERERIEAQKRRMEELQRKRDEIEASKKSAQSDSPRMVSEPGGYHQPGFGPESHQFSHHDWNQSYSYDQRPFPGRNGRYNDSYPCFGEQPPPFSPPATLIHVIGEIWVMNQRVVVAIHVPMCFESTEEFDQLFEEFKRQCADQIKSERPIRIEGFVSDGFALVNTLSDLLRCCRRDEFQRSNLCRLQAICVMN